MSNYKQIVWLASYPKSGNTWLRFFIEAYLLGKFDINNPVCSIGDNTSTRHNTGLGKDPRHYPIQIQHLTRHVGLLRMVEQFIQNRPNENFPLIVKTHNANLIPNGVTLLPEQLTSKCIHIVRDPRDVCISFSKHMNIDIDEGIEKMKNDMLVLSTGESLKMEDFVSSWKTHTKSFVEGDILDTITVRYEDMMDYPVETFSQVLEHIGIEAKRERVEKAIDDVEISKMREREKAEGFIEASPKNKEQFFGKGGSHWHEVLKPYQVNRIEKMAGRYMEMFNYKGRKAA